MPAEPPRIRLVRVARRRDGSSHLVDEQLEIEPHPVTPRTAPFDLGSAFFVSIDPVELDFHRAPCRKVIVVLTGAMDIECSDGGARRCTPGTVLLLEDVSGDGHRLVVTGEPVTLLSADLADDGPIGAVAP